MEWPSLENCCHVTVHATTDCSEIATSAGAGAKHGHMLNARQKLQSASVVDSTAMVALIPKPLHDKVSDNILTLRPSDNAVCTTASAAATCRAQRHLLQTCIGTWPEGCLCSSSFMHQAKGIAVKGPIRHPC